ncbi:MAG: GH116 family glycosyl hydrolase [Candidatus Poribacteria bacterium]|nr:GH116 family glycosyl hydrolase [Candidatus Poribacteria bacterium]
MNTTAIAGMHGGNSGHRNNRRLFSTDAPVLEWSQFPADGFSEPACGVIYRRKQRIENGMPLGGIDTGRLDLNTDATFGYCTIFNSICPEGGPLELPFLGMTVGEQVWLLSDPREAYGGYMWFGIQTPREIHYWGHYPVADLEYEMPGSPVNVGLRAWAPFLPGDSGATNTPGIVFEVHLRNATDTAQEGRLAFSFPGPTQAEAQIEAHSSREKARMPYGHTWIALAPEPVKAERQTVHGEFTGLVVTSEKVPEIGYALGVVGEAEIEIGGGLAIRSPSMSSGKAWAKIGSELPEPGETDFSGSISVGYQLPPGEEKVVRFVLAWYAPMWIGEGPHTFTHMYTTRYKSALDAAQFLSREHDSLLRRVLAWQEVIYTEANLPNWLQDSLINILHLFAINGLWAAARPPIGPWCHPEEGLFGLIDGITENPAVEPIPDTFYANAPLVFFFPDLALSTLRGYKAYQFANGAAPWIFGGVVGAAIGGYEPTMGAEFAMPTPGYQTTTNGPCYVDLVDRYLLRTGDKGILAEFYPSIKKNTIYTMNLRPEDGADGIISVPSGNLDPYGPNQPPGHHLEWFEAVLWFGMTSHVGGIHLANLRMALRLAEQVGDDEFARQCKDWLEQGSQSMEDKMWAGSYYLSYNEPKTGRKSDDVFGYQLDGQWMARFHGLPGVFRSDRVKETLETIKNTCAALTPYGALNFSRPDGSLSQGLGYGPTAYFTPELFMLAMTYMYEGDKDFGLELARRCIHNLTINTLSTWNLPNLVRGDNGDRLFGAHYVQNLMLWALPAAMEGKDISAFCALNGLVDRIIQAAGKRQFDVENV